VRAAGLGEIPREDPPDLRRDASKEQVIPLESQAIGLCEHCRHARTVTTPRSRFWLCARAASDPHYARYPRLPMLQCPGYENGEPAPIGKPEDPAE